MAVDRSKWDASAGGLSVIHLVISVFARIRRQFLRAWWRAPFAWAASTLQALGE